MRATKRASRQAGRVEWDCESRRGKSQKPRIQDGNHEREI